MSKNYQIEITKDEDSAMYIGEIHGLPACYTQAPTIPLLLERLIEVSEGSLSFANDSQQDFGFKLNIEFTHA